MGWRRTVHKLTGKCMGRSFNLSKGEVHIACTTECDGETLYAAELYKFGERTDTVTGSNSEVFDRIMHWVQHDTP